MIAKHQGRHGTAAIERAATCLAEHGPVPLCWFADVPSKGRTVLYWLLFRVGSSWPQAGCRCMRPESLLGPVIVAVRGSAQPESGG
jgi:hypothetical protein